MPNPLSLQLERLWARGHQTVTPEHPSLAVMIGCDQAGRGYDWNGLRRRVDPRGPELVIQVTLDGWGEFTDAAGEVHRVEPGQAFAAIIRGARAWLETNGGDPTQAVSLAHAFWGATHGIVALERAGHHSPRAADRQLSALPDRVLHGSLRDRS
jgi:hypothetical protein